jgi:iron complex transport system ATP-binding protein
MNAMQHVSMQAPLFSVSSIKVMRGQRTVLSDVSLDIGNDGVIGLIGPNGAGKTTLLKSMLGVLPVEGGEIAYDGQPIAQCPSSYLAQNISYMAQGAPCHWPMTVENVVALGRMPYHGSVMRLKDADHCAIQTAMIATGVQGFAKRSVLELSGGERARVMLARTLAGEPSVLLVDEPVAGLDPHYQLQVMEVLRQQAALGRRVVIVLHDLALAARYCDRVVLLNNGTIVADGTPQSVLTEQSLTDAYDVRCHITTHQNQMVVLPWSLCGCNQTTVHEQKLSA